LPQNDFGRRCRVVGQTGRLARLYNLHDAHPPGSIVRAICRRIRASAVVIGDRFAFFQRPGMTAPPRIRTIVSAPFEENSYVVSLPGREDCIVVDPGLEPDLILDLLRDEGLTVAVILNTHGHADHIGGNEALKNSFPTAPLIIGSNDAIMLTDATANMSALFGLPIVSPPADRTVAEGDVVEAAGMRFEVLDIPGHSPGHVVFILRDTPIVVFGGDVLFREGIGRTDFPGGDTERLLSGIRDKLYTLPSETIVYPGHGPSTTPGHERRNNPFVRS
jgi:hydroxyacylglutathione hydrolase